MKETTVFKEKVNVETCNMLSLKDFSVSYKGVNPNLDPSFCISILKHDIFIS
jgi:hypothetical protein